MISTMVPSSRRRPLGVVSVPPPWSTYPWLDRLFGESVAFLRAIVAMFNSHAVASSFA